MGFLTTNEERTESDLAKYPGCRGVKQAEEKIAALRGLLREALPHLDETEGIDEELLCFRIREEAFREPDLLEF